MGANLSTTPGPSPACAPSSPEERRGLEALSPLETAHLIFKPSPIHGLGGFASRDLPAGMLVIEYIGERISKAESIERCRQGNEYIFRLDDQFDLDGSVAWNPARFLNHSCAPNCETELIDGHIWVVALRPVKTGEEITFDYGYDLEDYRRHPCHCGNPTCAGFIVSAELRSGLRPAPPSP
jgi:uncharacterized protein